MRYSSPQVQAASGPVSGNFDIVLGERSLREVNANVTADNLRDLLNFAFNEEQGKLNAEFH